MKHQVGAQPPFPGKTRLHFQRQQVEIWFSTAKLFNILRRLLMGYNAALPSGNSTSSEWHTAWGGGEIFASLAKYYFWILH